MQRLHLTIICLAFLIVGYASSALGQGSPPTIAIGSPQSGEHVSPATLSVSGTASGLPENSLVVRVLDPNGAVLGEQATTVQTDAPGGPGAWQVTFALNVPPGTQGSVYAFAASPADGSIMAESSVPVTFGEQPPAPTEAPVEEPTATEPPPPVEPAQPIATPPMIEAPAEPTATAPSVGQPAAINISIPLPGEIVSPYEVVVVGTGAGLPENNLVVQARDANGAVLDQKPATVAAALGGAGEWRATLAPNAAAGTQGSIYAFAPSPADGSILAEAAINVTYGPGPAPTATAPPPAPTATAPPPATPAVRITIPVDGDVVNPNEVVVVGIGSALPGNSVIVQARDSDNNILSEQIAALAAPPDGTGDWQVTLHPNVAGGTAGNLYAFAVSPATGTIVADSLVNVVYGQAQAPTATATPAPYPAIRIDDPLPGEIVSPREVVVRGVGSALPENSVVVRALDSRGVILNEQSTTVNAALGASGEWQVTLILNVDPGTSGSIYAFAPDPATGGSLAGSQVNVLFGAAPMPVTPVVQIKTPRTGSTVNTATPFYVNGIALGLSHGGITVWVRDGYGQIVRQAVAAVAGDGSWSVAIDLLIANGTPGSIYAFSTALATGGAVGDSQVEVTFASDCVVRTDWPIYTVQPGDTLFAIAQATQSTVSELVIANCLPNPNLIAVGQQLHIPNQPVQGTPPQPPTVAIDTPAANASVDPSVPLSVTGVSSWTLEGGVLVRALDNLGQVLDERRVTVTEPVQNGIWKWRVDLRLSAVATGTHGTLFAYAPSLVDGSRLATAVVPVIYGADNGQPYITIDTPQPYAQLDLSNGVTVTGRGRGLFENNVVVQVLDQTRQTILEQPTTTDAQQPDVEGAWQINLPVNAIERGIIRAYAADPASGADVAAAEVGVTLGDPRSQSNYVQIIFPLPDTIVHGNGALQAVVGYAGGVTDDNVYALILNAGGRILFSLPVPFDEATGRWSLVTTQPLAIERDQDVVLQVAATSPTTGQILASDLIPLTVKRPTVSGEITYQTLMTLPEKAVVKVSVVHTALAEFQPDHAVLGRQEITNPGQIPIPFAVPYNPANLDERATYGVVVRIEDGDGNLLFMTKDPYPVITHDQPSEDVVVVVEPA